MHEELDGRLAAFAFSASQLSDTSELLELETTRLMSLHGCKQMLEAKPDMAPNHCPYVQIDITERRNIEIPESRCWLVLPILKEG